MRKIFLIAGLLAGLHIMGQTDTKFWFAAPDIVREHGNPPGHGRPLYIHISAVYATTVTITRPADPGFTPIIFPLAQGASRSILLEDYMPLDSIECYAAAGIENKGLLIEAGPGEITAFYEMNNTYNRDIFALKGQNALGTSFTVTTQNIFSNASGYNAYSGFVVVATEDNTQIEVVSNQNFVGRPAGTHTITLNRGQTFNFQATSKTNTNHPQGVKVRVLNNKPIAITVYDDSMGPNSPAYGSGGCLDTFGDQYIPDNLTGREYIVMKGQLGTAAQNLGNTRSDIIVITAIDNNTQVRINGALVTTLNARQVYSYVITNRLTYVKLSNPGYVNHISGTGYGCEQGGAVLPSIDNCTGSYDVTFARSGPAGDMFSLNIMVRNDTVDGSPTKNMAAGSFTLHVNGVDYPVPANYFTYTSDSAFAYLIDDSWTNGPIYTFFRSRIPSASPPTVATVRNSISRFHLGVMNGGTSNGGKYGYFSDYAANKVDAGLGGATAPTIALYCNLDPFRLVAAGGRSYFWTCTTHPHMNSHITDRTIAAPYFYPDTSNLEVYRFTVNIQGECYDTTITLQARVVLGPVSDFNLSENEGCSPFRPTIKNTTNPYYADVMTWIFDPPYQEVDQTTLPMTFQRTFVNNTDTIQTYAIKLYSLGPYNTCPDILERKIKVKPAIKANFSVSDTLGCHPLNSIFSNLSTGHLDSTSYYWSFGDNTQSFDRNPTHSYTNFTLSSRTYQAKLLVESPLGCRDSLTRPIQVYPRIDASFVVDTNYGCSPLTVKLNPSNSFGPDSLFWHIDYFYGDSIFATAQKNTIQITHRDTSLLSGPDTLSVFLVAKNNFGCRDTANARQLVVYPEIRSVLGISDTVVCDSVPVILSNNSQGINLRFEWDFGDNTYMYDNSLNSYTKRYLNRTNTNKYYTIALKAISNFQCESISDTVLTVLPFIKAQYGLSYENNCSPLDVKFTNTSIRAHSYQWNLGDGTTTNRSDAVFNHRYYNPLLFSDTNYHPVLIAYNNEGCTDTLMRNIRLYPPVVASFTPLDSSGCAPFALPIANLSTGGSLTFTWNFGDNVSSSESSPNFTKTYTNFSGKDTTYIISLTAKNTVGCDSSISGLVTVYAQIDADFTMPVRDTCPPFQVRLTNLSSAGTNYTNWYVDNTPFSNSWEPASPLILNNNTLIPDTTNIMLVAFGAPDAQHLACADTHRIPVIVYPQLNTDFVLEKNASCQPFKSSIQNTSNIISGTNFRWLIDNDFYSSLATPADLNIPNQTSGEMTKNLILAGRSQYGCTDTTIKAFIIHSLVDARFTISKPAICSGDSIYVDRTGSRGGIVSYNWNYNNEQTNTNSNTGFYYSYSNLTNPAPLSKFIRLTVANSSGCDSSWQENVTVYPKVTAAFDADYAGVCYPHLSWFINNSTNANTYFWTFGDGTGSTLVSPTHQFVNLSHTNNKVFSVNLVAQSQYLCVDSIRQNLEIYAKPYANFDFPISVDCPPFNAKMTDLSEGTGLSYNWNFAGEGSSTEKNPGFNFNNTSSAIQEKPVTLIVSSQNNCKDTLIKRLSVYPKVDVDFVPSASSGCAPLFVNFDGSVSNAQQIDWKINNKTFSTIEDPNYNFQNETGNNRIFNIKLKANSIYNCKDSVEKTITVYSAPIADFIPNPVPANYNTSLDATPISFSNETTFQPNWNYEWTFGDGSTSNETSSEFTHTYPAFFWGKNADNNIVPVRLVAWNKIYPICSDTIYHDIIIYPPLPEIDVMEIQSGCEPLEVALQAITKYVYEDSFEWDFGNGLTSKEPNPVISYTEPGLYTIKLVVYGEGGTNWDSKTVEVFTKPEVEFMFSDSLVYVASQTSDDDIIRFFNQSKYASAYEWYFDKNSFFDGGTPDSQDREPVHAYSDTGTYQVVLVAYTDKGCTDYKVHPHRIKVSGEGILVFPSGFFVNPTAGPSDDYNTNQVTPNMYLFYPKNKGVDKYKFEVYNRWGVLVFETSDVNQGWNGYIDGIPAKQDVYVWRAKGQFTSGMEFNISGDVTLLRAPVNVAPQK